LGAGLWEIISCLSVVSAGIGESINMDDLTRWQGRSKSYSTVFIQIATAVSRCGMRAGHAGAVGLSYTTECWPEREFSETNVHCGTAEYTEGL
jgi:hypothetical protein